MAVALGDREWLNLDRIVHFNESRILLARPALPEFFVEGEELVGELRADVGEDARRELIEISRLGQSDSNNRSARALEHDVVIGLDAKVGRSTMHAEAGLDGLASRQKGTQIGLDEDRQMNADTDARRSELGV